MRNALAPTFWLGEMEWNIKAIRNIEGIEKGK